MHLQLKNIWMKRKIKIDLWDELSDYQKSCVKQAKAEFITGKGKSHKEVMKKYSRYSIK